MKFKEVRQVEAKGRQEGYAALTLQQRLDKLDAMFGKGNGAKRERARIAKQMGKTAPAKVEPTLAQDVAEVSAAIVAQAKKATKKPRKTAKKA